MLLALAVALPFMLLTTGIVWQLADNERETRREAILFSTRTLMNAVDTMLNKQIAVAQMLAASPTLQADDLAAFRQEAERAARACRAAGSCSAKKTASSSINLSSPPMLRCRCARAVALQRRPSNTAEVQISDVFYGAS